MTGTCVRTHPAYVPKPRMPSGWTGPRDDTWTWVGQQDGDIGINVNSEIGDDDGDFWDVSTEAFRQNARRHHRDQEGA